MRLRTVDATSARFRPYSTTTCTSTVTASPSRAISIPRVERAGSHFGPAIATTPYDSRTVSATIWAIASLEIEMRPSGEEMITPLFDRRHGVRVARGAIAPSRRAPRDGRRESLLGGRGGS